MGIVLDYHFTSSNNCKVHNGGICLQSQQWEVQWEASGVNLHYSLHRYVKVCLRLCKIFCETKTLKGMVNIVAHSSLYIWTTCSFNFKLNR